MCTWSDNVVGVATPALRENIKTDRFNNNLQGNTYLKLSRLEREIDR